MLDGPELETERLLLRQWRDEDVSSYARICSDPEVMQFMFPPRAISATEAALDVQNLRQHWLDWGFGHWVVQEQASGRMVGRTGIKRHPDWSLDLENTEAGWLYERASWGKGYATEAGREVVRFLFEDLARPEAISIARPENTPSRHVMDKLGFTLAGQRLWEERGVEIVWYAKLRCSASHAPC